MSLHDIVNQTKSSRATFSVNDYENILLGAIISGNCDANDILKIKRDSLLSSNNRHLYEIIIKLLSNNDFIDYVSVVSELGKFIGEEDSRRYVDNIIRQVPSEFSLSNTIQAIDEKYIQRTSIEILETTRRNIQQNPSLASELMYVASDKIDKLSQTIIDYKFSDQIERTADEIISGEFSKHIIPSGLKAIDDIIGGWSTQEITLIGARPGHGKTTSAISLSLAALCANQNLKVVLFELEMSKETINSKFIVHESGVSAYAIRIHKKSAPVLKDEDFEKIQKAKQSLKKYDGRLFVYDNVYDLHSMAKICRSVGANLAFVDFITLMDGVDEDKRNELGRIAKYAKRFAKSNNMAFIFYSQLNRGPDQRENHAPTMSDLAESDQLGQLASEVMLLYFPYKYTFDDKDKNVLRLIFDKARYSNIGNVRIFFNPDLMIMRDLPASTKS